METSPLDTNAVWRGRTFRYVADIFGVIDAFASLHVSPTCGDDVRALSITDNQLPTQQDAARRGDQGT